MNQHCGSPRIRGKQTDTYSCRVGASGWHPLCCLGYLNLDCFKVYSETRVNLLSEILLLPLMCIIARKKSQFPDWSGLHQSLVLEKMLTVILIIPMDITLQHYLSLQYFCTSQYLFDLLHLNWHWGGWVSYRHGRYITVMKGDVYHL